MGNWHCLGHNREEVPFQNFTSDQTGSIKYHQEKCDKQINDELLQDSDSKDDLNSDMDYASLHSQKHMDQMLDKQHDLQLNEELLQVSDNENDLDNELHYTLESNDNWDQLCDKQRNLVVEQLPEQNLIQQQHHQEEQQEQEHSKEYFYNKEQSIESLPEKLPKYPKQHDVNSILDQQQGQGNYQKHDSQGTLEQIAQQPEETSIHFTEQKLNEQLKEELGSQYSQ